MALNLRTKVILVVSATLLFVLAANLFVVTTVFNRSYGQAVTDKVTVVGRSLALQLDKLLKFGIPLNELVGFEEQCKEIKERYKDISSAMVVDPDGKILFHNDPAKHGETLAQETLLQAIKRAKEETLFFRNKSPAYFSLVPYIDQNGNHLATIVLEIPASVITKEAQAIFLPTFAMGAVTFLLSTVILVFVLNVWITKPLKNLVDVVKGIRVSGDLSGTVAISSKDEIGELASEFNEMAKKLREFYGVLEQRVKERTVEAEEAKKKLEILNQELQKKLEEFERMNKLMVGRELKMAEMKKEIVQLKKETNKSD